MRISARNQIKGTVVEVKKGATTSHVRVDIGGGQIVTSAITNEAVDELGIKAGGKATVVGFRRHDRGGLTCAHLSLWR
jgi:molybdopterin-binding protein